MRHGFRRGLAASAAAALLLAGCGDGGDEGGDAPDETQEDTGEDAGEGAAGEEPEDPNENIEDGVYAGNGVLLPVPDGWELAPQALQQGIVAAVSEDQESQMTAGAVDTEGQDLDFDDMLDSVREQLDQEPDVDEEIEFQGAERAQRISISGLPAQQEGMPDSDVTFILADNGNGLLGEFAFAAPSGEQDEELVDLLIAEGGFDPDSEPPEMPAQPQQPQQPAPEGQGGGEMSEEDMEELQEQFEEQMEEQEQSGG